MSGDIIQLNPEAFQSELKVLVKNSIDTPPEPGPSLEIHFNGKGDFTVFLVF